MSELTANELLSIAKSPGAQYIFLKPEGVILNINAGLADVQSKSPVESGTTFNAYSTTKALTATSVMLLAESGKIRLNDTVNDIFPEYSFSGKFTVKQLLSHQSGIGNPLPISWVHLLQEENSFNEKDFTKKIIAQNVKLKFSPDTKASYSNVGYLLLGQLIEKISGVNYATFVTENILKKSIKTGMLEFSINPEIHATGYHPRFSFSNILLGFMLDKKKYMKLAEKGWAAFKQIYVNGKPYGGLIGNAHGFSDYLNSLMNYSILSEVALAKMFEVQRGGLCLSWFAGKLGKHDYFCHAGGGGGYYCEIRLYPKLLSGSVLMTNRSGFSDKRLLDKIDGRFIS